MKQLQIDNTCQLKVSTTPRVKSLIEKYKAKTGLSVSAIINMILVKTANGSLLEKNENFFKKELE